MGGCRAVSAICHVLMKYLYCYIESRLKKVKDRKRKDSSLVYPSDDGGSD